MELVYLWVEDYKNIHQQGFNFSPRFKCEFDGINLTIEEKEYVSIFPDNINITAIVGENGSGKSSILVEILNQAENKLKNFFCFYDQHKKEIISNIKINQNLNDIIVSERMEELLNTSFFYHYKKDTDLPILNNRYAIYNEKSSIYIEPNKNDNKLNIKIEEEKILKKLINLVCDNFYEQINIKEFFVPQVISLSINEDRLQESYNDECWEKYEQLNKEEFNRKELLLLQNILYFKSLFSAIYGGIELTADKQFDKFDINVLSSNPDEIKKEISRCVNELNQQNFLEQINDQTKKEFQDRYILQANELTKSLNLFKNIDQLCGLWQKSKNGEDSDWLLRNKICDNKENIEFLQNLPRFLKIDFFIPRRAGYYNLSSGEKIFLELLYSVRDIVNLREKNESSKNIFILLDEIENSLHPAWQKKLIYALISFLKIYKINIHIIISSHSPFILSDLPKENVIFLKEGKQVDVDIETFGANIHTLLSHGFFMQNGLMGEFAKEKINNLIKVLSSKRKVSKKNQKYYKNLISLIGEPFLKEKLSKMYDEKFQISKEERIKQLKKELVELEK